jgi:hypothetical protein
MSIKETRELGLGSNFTVSNPEDGYRKDNRLWFGKCNRCGERVTNSSLSGVWEHTIPISKDGYTMSKGIDYCPKIECLCLDCEEVDLYYKGWCKSCVKDGCEEKQA